MSLFLRSFVFLLLLSHIGRGSNAEFLLPLNCTELLPDQTQFLSYFESVGKGQVKNNKRLSQRIFKILALRERLQKDTQIYEGKNPVDHLIQKTLCFYRQQKEPLAPVPFDDPKVVSFINQNLKELEAKVEAVVLEVEYRKAKESLLRRKALKYQKLVEEEKQIANRKANELFKILSNKANRKAQKEG